MRFPDTLKTIAKHDLTLISFFYAISYGFMLFNNGRFYDDWMFYQVDTPSVIGYFKQARLEWCVYFIQYILSFGHVFIFRFISFFAHGLIFFLAFRILETIKEINRQDRFFVVLIFAVFPVYAARIAFTHVHYSLSLTSFFIAFSLWARYLQRPRVLLRLLILGIFYFSFFTPSLLMLYGAVIFYIFYINRETIKTKKDATTVVLRYLDFFILPLLFWFIRNRYFMPYGSFTEWNHISPMKVLAAPFKLLVCFGTSFFVPLQQAIGFAIEHLVYFLTLGYMVFLCIFRAETPEIGRPPLVRSVRLLLLGLILFVLGAFPYVAVGRVPGQSDGADRFQLLLSLGASLTLYFGLKIGMERFKIGNVARNYIFAFIVGAFVVTNMAIFLDYHIDAFKQMSLVELFRSSDIIKNNTNFLFVDNTAYLNASRRSIPFYEYNGLFRSAFHDSKRYGESKDVANGFDTYLRYRNYRGAGMEQYKPIKPQYTVIIGPGSFLEAGWRMLPSLFYRQIFRPDEFRERLRNMLVLRYEKCDKQDQLLAKYPEVF